MASHCIPFPKIEYGWLFNIERQALQCLSKSLNIETKTLTSLNSFQIINIIFDKYTLYNIPGYNDISFKVFVSEYDVVIFELNNNGKYSLQDFIIPTLTINNYDRVSYLENSLLIKRKSDIFLIGETINKIF